MGLVRQLEGDSWRDRLIQPITRSLDAGGAQNAVLWVWGFRNIANMGHDLRSDFKTSHKDKMKVILLRSIRGPFGSED